MNKAATTRQNILLKAFDLIYTKGYNATSIDDIIATTQVTKGAFYYHFKNKDEMGLAIINEVLKPTLKSSFVTPLQQQENPLHAIYNMMHHLLMENEFLKVEYGCPASNLTQEMAPWHSDFNKALDELATEWNQVLIHALEAGKKKGLVNKKVNAKQVTTFILSGYWGIRNIGKLSGDRSAYLPYLKELKKYLGSLV